MPATTLSSLRSGRHARFALRRSIRLTTALCGFITAAPVVAGAQQARGDPRWNAVAQALGRTGKVEDGYYRLNYPRSDLTVHIGEQKLAPAFEMTSYFGFIPVARDQVLAMGELVLQQQEVHAVMEEARRQGVDVPALHNHLIGETPRLLYVHVIASGEAATVARKLRAMLSRTSTPQGAAEGEATGDRAAWAAVSAVLGDPAEVARETAEWEFARRESIQERGVAVKSSGAIETASEVVFQRLAGGSVATTGELFLRPQEVTPVTHALEAGGIRVTAIHTHMLEQTPMLVWLHWYGMGEPATLARAVRNALERTNSVVPPRGAGER